MIINEADQLVKLILILFLVPSMLISEVNGVAVDHCYSDIGCFPLSAEFYNPRHRPINVRPWHRKRIKTRFQLFNRQHPEGYFLRPWDKLNLFGSHFNPLLETKIIVPGWLDNIKRALWVRRLKDSFLWLWKPVNIIVIHWRNFTPYTIATANTRVVGAELANLLKFIEHELNYDRSYHHLIGHSLGAHISGYCGDRLPGLGRITALDPARPFFQHMPKSVRLDRGDARFVDAIHSDFTPENAIFFIMSFGMTTPVGHVDFYPNGPPLLQPGCLRDTILSIQNGIRRGLEHSSLSVAFLESIRYLTACDHQRSHQWFIESITNRQCVFVGVRCNEFEGLINGRCTCDNSRSACAIMGIHADQMYLNDAHEDLWPDIAKRRPTGAQPTVAFGDQNREQTYARLKHRAHLMRKPPGPTIFQDREDSNLTSNIVKDQIFLDYLRTNLLSLSQHSTQPTNLPGKQSSRIEPRQASSNPNDDLGLNLLIFNNNNQTSWPPKLMSDVDRDIEQWYEESSRWYLKTNNKETFCVNQYQVLIFLGPLRTTTGRDHIRANLILSIIGSRGKLTNQRFKPKSPNLDSYTMQPFFILLEGSYSLGNIISVAIGWEFRSDPDPVQATISFQSNLLENLEPMLPSYKARHPWLSETLKYDYSGAFTWRQPVSRPTSHLYNSGLYRRSETISKEAQCPIRRESNEIDSDEQEFDSSLVSELNDLQNSLENDRQVKARDLLFESALVEHLNNDGNIVAKLHNIGIHQDRDLEDSIVIEKVVISPLQANYGRNGAKKVGKTFCPPHKGYRLRSEQTVKLMPNLIGKCHYNGNDLHPYQQLRRPSIINY